MHRSHNDLRTVARREIGAAFCAARSTGSD